jgi:hypothetical protein
MKSSAGAMSSLIPASTNDLNMKMLFDAVPLDNIPVSGPNGTALSRASSIGTPTIVLTP